MSRVVREHWDKERRRWVAGSRKIDFLEPRHYVIGTIKPFVSPVDGALVDGRRQLREHNRTHGVVDQRELKGHEFKVSKMSSARDDVTEVFKRSTGKL